MRHLLAITPLMLFAGCFNPSYSEDISFTCKIQQEKNCPDDYVCMPEGNPDLGRCHRTCDRDKPNCAAGNSCIQLPNYTPVTHVCVRGAAGDGGPTPGCTGHMKIGPLLPDFNDQNTLFDVAVDSQGRAHVVYIDDQGRLVEDVRNANGTSHAHHATTNNTSAQLVAAAIDRNDRLHIVYASPNAGAVHYCTRLVTDSTGCPEPDSAAIIKVGGLGDPDAIHGLDLSATAGPSGPVAVLVASVLLVAGQEALVYVQLKDPAIPEHICWIYSLSQELNHPRIGAAQGDAVLISAFENNTVTGDKHRLWRIDGNTQKTNNVCLGMPDAVLNAPLFGGVAIGSQDTPNLHLARPAAGPPNAVQHAVWGNPPVTDPVFETTGDLAAQSVDLVVAGVSPVVSAFTGDPNVFAAPHVWVAGTSGWRLLDAPTPLTGGSTRRGEFTRMAARPGEPIHVVHDGTKGTIRTLYYMQCNP